ncbi:hypothetical protein [Candidatus Chrysopegis kryptomonas]|uniref:Uncharacterized protein n=1 Tax=Candidatus Chryseopegocella kryptomonas TaxID=1633643 RepID=A0A0P1MXS9_9BACT|nr:hypothetical protein [Candidatus Chrysopegis kryptomonas]CUT00880.1 hypothetical protein JGI23_00937 [Candidatus Chrysopegis kryptomonas]
MKQKFLWSLLFDIELMDEDEINEYLNERGIDFEKTKQRIRNLVQRKRAEFYIKRGEEFKEIYENIVNSNGIYEEDNVSDLLAFSFYKKDNSGGEVENLDDEDIKKKIKAIEKAKGKIENGNKD